MLPLGVSPLTSAINAQILCHASPKVPPLAFISRDRSRSLEDAANPYNVSRSSEIGEEIQCPHKEAWKLLNKEKSPSRDEVIMEIEDEERLVSLYKREILLVVEDFERKNPRKTNMKEEDTSRLVIGLSKEDFQVS